MASGGLSCSQEDSYRWLHVGVTPYLINRRKPNKEIFLMFAGQPPANRIKNLKEKKYFKYGFEF